MEGGREEESLSDSSVVRILRRSQPPALPIKATAAPAVPMHALIGGADTLFPECDFVLYFPPSFDLTSQKQVVDLRPYCTGIEYTGCWHTCLLFPTGLFNARGGQTDRQRANDKRRRLRD